MQQINKEQLKCLIYNIFPGGDTILHLLSNDAKLIEALYYGCHSYSDEEKRLKANFHLPFLKNFKGETPMDLAKTNIRLLDNMLLNLIPYGIDHHSREIQHLFEFFFQGQQVLPSLNKYLQSRIIQTVYIKNIDKAIINNDSVTPGISKSSFWVSTEERQSLLKQDVAKKPSEDEDMDEDSVEKEVRIEFIDIASLHNYISDEGDVFF